MKLPIGTIATLQAGLFGSKASALPVLADKTPATEFTIFRAGVNDSDYGPVVFDEIAAAFVQQALSEKGLAVLPFDFNHGQAKEYATAEEGKSAGYFTPVVRDGALMATDIKWTEEAYGRIQRGEYGLFSPWFDTIITEDGVKRPCRLFNVAILNCAGLNGIDAIAAGARNHISEESIMTAEEETRLRERVRQLEAENEQLRANKHELVSLGTTMLLSANHGTTERANGVHRLMTLRAEVCRVTGKDTDEAAIGELHALKTKAGEVDTLKAKAEAAEQDGLKKELDSVFEMGARDGHVAAGPAGRKEFEDVTLAAMKSLTDGKLTPAMVVVARQHIKASAKVNTPTTPGARAPSPGSTGGGAAGSNIPADLLQAGQKGASEKNMQAAWARQQARRGGGAA